MNHAERIEGYLRENDAQYIPDEIYELLPEYGKGDVCLSITWGDWKHDHARLDYLMKKFGYELMDKVITEENGSDCYSADHYYKYKNN